MGASPSTTPHPPHIVILGGGFGGLLCARALRGAPVKITLVDRTNHHLFQPLLYQVATAGLSPGEIASPIRRILSSQKNASVILGEAVSIDAPNRTVRLADGVLTYDTLVVATGAQTSYFGNDAWEPLAPGLKTLDDAIEIRRKFLLAFEHAEVEPDPAAQRACLTFVVVGGGPTGVELAGTMAELARRAFVKDFRRIDTSSARIILIEGGPRLLPAFPPALSERARKDLEKLGVQVWLNIRVTGIDAHGVDLGNDRIATSNVIWAAGIRATSIVRTLPVEPLRDGRIAVNPDLTIPGHSEIFVIGDLARVMDRTGTAEVPGVAPAAMQMGTYVGKLIAREAKAQSTRAERAPFRYRDKGTLATIGRASAVAKLPRLTLTGYPAWVFWLGLHIFFLIGFRNRVIVLIQWAWSYFTFERGARLISGRRLSED